MTTVAAKDLEGQVRRDKHHVLVEVKVNEATYLEVGVESVSKKCQLELVEFGNDNVGL